MATIADLLNQAGTAAQNPGTITEPGKELSPDVANIVANAPAAQPDDIGWQLFVEASKVAYGLFCPPDPNDPEPVAVAIQQEGKQAAVTALAAAIVAALGIASPIAGLLAAALVTFVFSEAIASQCPAWLAWNANPQPIVGTVVPPDIYKGE
ncbi:hypothetical protein AB3X91_14765 [Paraburkholderia sp. BR14263]|uniref:hypothetical protein n=1 Tax=unclassified Paraburkholderia TaxID=2615204 RepID=UPI0034CDC74E